MKQLSKPPLEVRLRHFLPFFLVAGSLINFQIAGSSNWKREGFELIALHSSHFADYSADPLDLDFAAIDPAIIAEVQADNHDKQPAIDPGSTILETPTPELSGPSPTPTAQSSGSPAPTQEPTQQGQPTATPSLPLPTIPIPTDPLDLPTIVPTSVPTLPVSLPTLPIPTLPLPTLAHPNLSAPYLYPLCAYPIDSNLLIGFQSC